MALGSAINHTGDDPVVTTLNQSHWRGEIAAPSGPVARGRHQLANPSWIHHDGTGVFRDLPDPIEVGRYHSLAVERGDVPDALAETARTDDENGVVMGVRHTDRPHEGVQFHPESILTPHGKQMVRTFVGSCLE